MLCLVRTKACKRCGGDLSLERDKYGSYMECIQCGASWNESDLMHPVAKMSSEQREPVIIKVVASQK